MCFGSVCQTKAQGTSNKGTDFWLMYGNHVSGYRPNQNNWQQMAMYITSDVSTTGTVEIPGINYTLDFSVIANQVTVVQIPRSAYIGGTEGKFNKGIHLKSARPVVAYAHIYDNSVSGATLVLPTNTLGKEYYSLNFTQKANALDSYSFCAIVAVEDNTQVIVTPSVPTQGGWAAGVAQTINLNKGEVYQILGLENSQVDLTPNAQTRSYYTTGGDLTGTTIKSVAAAGQSCKRIAVFSGSGKMSIGCLSSGGAPGAADNLFQQVYPTSTWGKSFVTVPSKNRNYDIYRIFKSSPNAVVKLNGVVIPNTSFVNDFYYQFDSQQTNYIESDNAIQVVQYQVTQNRTINCTSSTGDLGDPEMIYLNPLEQTLDKITMYSTSLFNILAHYINVVIRTDDVASFTLDGVVQANNFLPVTDKPGYSYAQLEVNAGTHTLQANGGFNAIAYGFGTNESYGYAAGASLISPGIEVYDNATAVTKREAGCLNEKYDVYVSLPYQPLSILIDFDNGQPPANVPLQLAETYINNNITYYKYKIAKALLFDAVKKYQLKVTAEKPISDGCGAVDELQLEYEVVNKPISSFEVLADVACEGSVTTFTDRSQNNGADMVKWHWDFGDGQTEVRTNATPFTHTYSHGNYVAKLFVENQAGCISEVFSKNIIVYRLPTPRFAAVLPLCENQAIRFQDQSTATDGNIGTWLWDFGDGNTSTDPNPEHSYAVAGTYNVKLTVTTQYGCENSITQSINVNTLPKVDFELPDFCLADANAVFVNKSEISTNEQLTYLWNFGDPNASAQRPNTATTRNATHTYTSTGIYEVTLTVRSLSGCVVVVKKQFTVNGSIPVAAFEVQNENSLCSNAPVVFKDKSTVDFGEITKVVWYFDYANKTTPDWTDEQPNLRADLPKEYLFKYPTFNNVASKSYVVKMSVYSGGSCVNEQFKTITLYPEPVIAFAPTMEVCLEVPSVQLVANEVNERPGLGSFSGVGVSATGIFRPLSAGLGTHAVKYTFTTTYGCTLEKTQLITVNETPTIDAGEDKVILEGEKGILSAIAYGQNLTYKWSPAKGLDKDDVLNPTVTPTEDMVVYTLTVTSDKGCTQTDQVKVKMLRHLEIPNTITPNGDGVNDEWKIKHIEDYPNATVEIYDRFGQNIFKSKGYHVPFNGTYNNSPLPVATYYYIINLAIGKKPITGNLTIIR